MKFLLFQNSHRLFLLFAPLAFVSLSGCATPGGDFRQNPSVLPIEVHHATGGEITSARAFETPTTLYVSGIMQKPPGSHLGVTAHVKVELLDADGNVVAQGGDDVEAKHPSLSLGRSRRHAFVVRFPLATARTASTIMVTAHPSSH